MQFETVSDNAFPTTSKSAKFFSNFQVTCSRISTVTANGDVIFPNSVVQFGTNIIPYKGVFIQDEFLGPLTASAYAADISSKNDELAKLRAENQKLLKSMRNIVIKSGGFYIGPSLADPTAKYMQYNDGTDPDAIAKAKCQGAQKMHLQFLGRPDSNRSHYAYGCVTYPNVSSVEFPSID